MNRSKRNFSRAVLVFALSSASMAGAQLVADTARQSSSGSLKVLTYYQGVQDQKVNFAINDGGTCVAPGAFAPAFSCGGGGKVEAKGSGGAGLVKLAWQPGERITYYAQAGLGEYSLSVPSSTVTNVLSGDNPGLLFGAGLKGSVVPDTVVTPAVSLDLSMTRAVYNFNRSFPGGAPGAGIVSERLSFTTYQFAVVASHLFTVDKDWKVEPYGGLKWTRVQADLKDLVSGSHAGGQTDVTTPFLGLRVPVEERQAFFAEASFVGGYHYGAGLELRFK